jgi:5-bromo-4-chloroindolyl phosphate hydrolysis protein
MPQVEERRMVHESEFKQLVEQVTQIAQDIKSIVRLEERYSVLQEDHKELRADLIKTKTELQELERKVDKAINRLMGACGLLGIIWSLFQFAVDHKLIGG